MIRFPRPNGHSVLVPLDSGITWTNGVTTLRIVDSGYAGPNRWAVASRDGAVFGFRSSRPAATTLAQRVARYGV
jgi:hypothetical protein